MKSLATVYSKREKKPCRIKKNLLFTFVLFIIYPLGSLPFIIHAMIHRKKYGFIFFGLFMGLIGVLIPPTGDFYRYTEDAQIIKNFSWDDFFLFASLKFDFFLAYLSYFITHLNINFDFSRFIYNSIGYILWGLMYLKLINSNKQISKKENIVFLAIFIPVTLTTFLFRFFFSMILFLYGSYEIILYKNKKGWIYVIFSVFSHASFVIFFIGLILSQFKFLIINRNYILVLCLMALCLDSNVMIYLLNYLPLDFVNHFMEYLDGKWAGDFLEEHSLKYRIMLFMGNSIAYATILIYYFIYNKMNKEKLALSNYILFTVVLSIPFVTINGRFLIVFLYNFKIIFMQVYRNDRLFRKCRDILLILAVLSTLTGLWSVRREWNLGDGSILLFSSFPTIISHTYSEKWISEHVYQNGDFVK